MKGWIDGSIVSGVLVIVLLVSLVVVAEVEVAVISPYQCLVVNMRKIFVILARAAAASSSSFSGSYDSQLVPRL